jgi:hypothetical protein
VTCRPDVDPGLGPDPAPLPRARRRLRAPALLSMVAIALLFVSGSVRAQGSVADIKAEMLFNIAKFVSWPPATAGGQMTFTILGEDDLAAVLASTLSTKSINGRKVFVRFVRRVSDARDSQILFVAGSEASRIPEVLEALRGLPVLTVADVPGFTAMGGMVDFVQENEKVRFEINPSSAERSQLKISARVLALAKIVAPLAQQE